MKSNILFLIIWGVLIVVGTIGSILMHIDVSAAQAIRAWATNDIIYILLYGWGISAFIILYLYVKSLKPREKEEANTNTDTVNEDNNKKEDTVQETEESKE